MSPLLSLFFVVLLYQTTTATPVDPCRTSEFLSIRIGYADGTECTQIPCVIYIQEYIHLDMVFEVDHEVETITERVDATLPGVGTVPIRRKNGCSHLYNTVCPLDAGERVSYHLELFLPDFVPETSVHLKVDLADENVNQLTCFELDAYTKLRGKAENKIQ